MAIITLTTDFGTADWFVGSMKGVMLGINPQVTIVDITHEIPTGDVRTGAFALAVSYKCFPRLTVHVAVVDPGVGSERVAIAAKTADYWFVGPDNGLLSFALAQEKVVEVRRLTNDVMFRQPVSNTFHGRDIFAPVAARLTQGIIVDSLGEELEEYASLPWPETKLEDGGLHGEIIHIDHFGNAITNIDLPALSKLGQRSWRVSTQGRELGELRKFYQEAPTGEPLALLGSSGFVEVAVNGGHAARALELKIGDPVEVK